MREQDTQKKGPTPQKVSGVMIHTRYGLLKSVSSMPCKGEETHIPFEHRFLVAKDDEAQYLTGYCQ
jgi:hypothetical protein